MAPLRWRYYGPITVVLDDGPEFEGTGRFAERLDVPGGWWAEIIRLPDSFNDEPDLAGRQMRVRLPGGGEAVATETVPAVVAGGRRAGHWLVVTGEPPAPELPRRSVLSRARTWLRWQLGL